MSLSLLIYGVAKSYGKDWAKVFFVFAALLAAGVLLSSFTAGFNYRIKGSGSAPMRGAWSVLSNGSTMSPGFMEISWWGWKKEGPFQVRLSKYSTEDSPAFEYYKNGEWLPIDADEENYVSGETDNRGFHEY
jgi:hypothetical protein